MVGTLITASMAAYALARLRFSGRNVWFALMLSTCLLYTSDAADDLLCVDLGGRRII